MRAFWYTAIVKVLVLLAYTLILLRIVTFSRETRMKDVLASTNNSTLDAEIDICYPLRLSKKSCFWLENPDQLQEKVDHSGCEDHMPIGCCTKNLRKPSEIIEAFENKIKDLVSISSQNTNDQPKQSYQIQSDQICVKYNFVNLQQSNDSRRSVNFEIQSSESNYQPFDIHLSFVRKYQDTNETYVAARRNLIRRNCWVTNGTSGCLEIGKDVTIEIEYFSVRYLREPFDTRCKEGKETPAECYENCVKNETSYYLMPFDRNDTMDLTFDAHDYMKCARVCDRPNCLTAAFYITGIDERANNKTYLKLASNFSEEIQNFPGLITLTALSANNGLEAIPVLSQQRFIWMISVSVAVFMGFDCFGIFVRTTKLYGKTGNNKKNPKRSHVKVFFALFIFSVSCTLAYFCEKILFDFGADPGSYNETYITEIESLQERNVSLSVCFDLCSVWTRNEKTACDETFLSNLTLDELESNTNDDSWFRARASMKNNVKYVPIRQKDKIIPTFYRNLKKCWLINHETKNVLPHLPVQRKSFIHLTLQPHSREKTQLTPNYTHFYIEDGDGFVFPAIDAQPGRKSVLHNVVVQYEKGACEDFTGRNETESTAYLANRDDLVQRCIVDKFVEQFKSLPVFVNLKVYDETKKYLGMPFKRERDRDIEVKLIEECEKNVTERQCIRSLTTLTHFELLEEQLGNDACDKGGQYIVVNLTPILFEKKYHERESYLVVFNRFISFVTLFTCYSVVSSYSDFRLFIDQISLNRHRSFVSILTHNLSALCISPNNVGRSREEYDWHIPLFSHAALQLSFCQANFVHFRSNRLFDPPVHSDPRHDALGPQDLRYGDHEDVRVSGVPSLLRAHVREVKRNGGNVR